MEFFIVHFQRPGDPDWRMYTSEGRASAALHHAMNRRDGATGGVIYTVDLGGLREVERRGMVVPENQDPLF